ncbi:MAG: dihydrodipicolinate synthase family protein [Armatimonadetes bacterium]|nr:dihydrodipicolinate synthase family protein [Armatimonadota bacterium]
MSRAIDWRGVFAVLVTPFTDDQSIDVESLRRQIRFCVACGVQAVVGPVVASEFFTLSDDERRLFYRVTVAELGSKIPYVAGVSGTSGPHAAELALAAAGAGADAILAMPPYVTAGNHRERGVQP